MAASTPYLFVSFDVDPGSTALAVGADCTFEASDGTPSGWHTDHPLLVSLAQSTDTCHAGTESLKLTYAAATPDVYWRDTVAATPGWYMAMAYLKPATTPRAVTLLLAFYSAGFGSLLASDTETVTESATGWTPLVALAQAPAGTAIVQVNVEVAGATAGEVHYVDTFACDYLGTMIAGPGLKRLREFSGSRGAENEYELPAAGEATFKLLDVTGNLSPDSTTAAAPYLGNVDTGRQVVFLIRTPTGRLLPLFWGLSDSWTEDVVTPATSWVTLHAIDAYRWLTAKQVLAPYRAEVMLDGPVTYLPLGDAAGTTSTGFASPDGTTSAVGSIVGDGAYAPVLSSRFGPGGTVFGGDPVLPKLSTGHTSDDDQPGVTWNPVTATDHGDVVNLSALPGALSTGPFTVEMWIILSMLITPASDQVLWRQALGDAANGLALVWQTDGLLHLFSGSSSAFTGPDLRDGLPHYIAVTYNGSGTASLVWDGGGLSGGGAVGGFVFPYTFAPDTATLGGVAQLAVYNMGFLYRQRMAHFAIYNKVLSGTRMLAHWVVGHDGGGGETEGNRFGGILNLVGWPVGRTRVDVGQSALLGRSWSAATVLSVLQQVAGQGSARPWVDAAGKVVMRNRHHKVNQASGVTLGPIARRGWSPIKNDDHLVNKQKVVRTSGATTLTQDAASISRHGEHAGQDVELAITSEAEAAGYGKWVVLTRKDNSAKYPTAILQVGARPALWDTVLLRELGDRVQIPGPNGTVDGFLEKFTWSTGSTPLDVEFELILSAWRAVLHQMAQLDTGTGLSKLDNALCELGWY